MFEHERISEKKTSSSSKWNIKSYVFMVAMSMVFVVLIVIGLTVFEYVKFRLFQNRYVTSQYSQYCYFVGDANPSMKTRMYFRTLSECGKPLYGYE